VSHLRTNGRNAEPIDKGRIASATIAASESSDWGQRCRRSAGPNRDSVMHTVAYKGAFRCFAGSDCHRPQRRNTAPVRRRQRRPASGTRASEVNQSTGTRPARPTVPRRRPRPATRRTSRPRIAADERAHLLYEGKPAYDQRQRHPSRRTAPRGTCSHRRPPTPGRGPNRRTCRVLEHPATVTGPYALGSKPILHLNQSPCRARALETSSQREATDGYDEDRPTSPRGGASPMR